MIEITTRGSFKKTNSYLQRLLEVGRFSWLDKYGKKGVEALKEVTPVRTGRLQSSWYYKIEHLNEGAKLIWCNSDIEGGKNIAILVASGHSTKRGVYIPPNDFITPAILPIIEEIVEAIRKEIEG